MMSLHISSNHVDRNPQRTFSTEEIARLARLMQLFDSVDMPEASEKKRDGKATNSKRSHNVPPVRPGEHN
jgi:hypothetical protein